MNDFLKDNTWVAAAAGALILVCLALLAHRIGRAVLLRLTRGSIVPRAMVEDVDRPASAVLPLLALQAAWQAAPDSLAFIGMVRHTNGLLLIAALTWLVMGLIGGLARGVIERHPATAADNLHARSIHTQTKVLSRSAMVLAILAGSAMALMTFPGARQVGASLLASAGVLGIIGGLAARPVFSNLISGLQLALAQPIRLDDVLIVKGEWGRVEEITGTYVVLRIWDERRLIIPLQWFIENPFENWTRSSANILGTVILHLDYATPMDALRAEAQRVVAAAPEWDGRLCVVHVTDATERAMQVRILVSAADSGNAFELRCKVREAMLGYLAREHPHCLPQLRMAESDKASLP